MLYSLMLPSHNDTAVAIAEHISGSQSKFARLMNQKAAQIGCSNTHFVTANGLDVGYNHYTTASDLARIASYAIKNQLFETRQHQKLCFQKSEYTETFFGKYNKRLLEICQV